MAALFWKLLFLQQTFFAELATFSDFRKNRTYLRNVPISLEVYGKFAINWFNKIWKWNIFTLELEKIKTLLNQFFMHLVSNELNEKKRVNINYVSNEHFWLQGSFWKGEEKPLNAVVNCFQLEVFHDFNSFDNV